MYIVIFYIEMDIFMSSLLILEFCFEMNIVLIDGVVNCVHGIRIFFIVNC